MTPAEFMDEIVVPTLREFRDDRRSRRLAYLACVVTIRNGMRGTMQARPMGSAMRDMRMSPGFTSYTVYTLGVVAAGEVRNATSALAASACLLLAPNRRWRPRASSRNKLREGSMKLAR
jgi:hypothetical protein